MESKLKKCINLIFTLIMTIISIYFIYELIKINVLPKKYLIVIISIILVLDIVILLLSLKYRNKIIITVLCILLSIVYSIGSYYFNKTSSTIDNISNNTETKVYISIITLKDSELSELSDINNKNIGEATSIDVAGTNYLVNDLKENNININETKYESLELLCSGLYNHEVDAIILNNVYIEFASELSNYTNFEEETKVIYTFTYEKETIDTSNKVSDITKDAFNLLITGTDSRDGVNSPSRSDVNMILTINPTSGIILLTSIPRDYYVPEVCKEDEGCKLGVSDKLSRTGVYGMNVVKETIEGFMNIEINYTLKVSFDSVIDIVDALGGIDVYIDSDAALSSKGWYEGYHTFTGEEALEFSRERHAYATGDHQRIKNQQTILKAIINKLISPSIITSYPSLLEAISGTFITDLTTEEITSFIQHQIDTSKHWVYEQYYLQSIDDWGYSVEVGDMQYMGYPVEETIVTGRNKIEAVLSGKSSANVN